MSVDEEINAVDLFQQIHGAVALGLVVNAQVAQADNVLAALRLQGVHLLLGAVEHLLAGQEGHALNLGGMGLGGGLRGVQAEEADLGAVGGGEHLVGLKGHLAVVQHVGGHDGELSVLGQLGQVLIAVVELMVAGGGQIVARQVHQFHGRGALGRADHGFTLAEIAGVHQQDVGASGLKGVLQRSGLGIAGNGAVNVVGVQDHDAALHVLGGGLLRTGGDGHGQCHDQRQQESSQLTELLHENPPSFFFARRCRAFAFSIAFPLKKKRSYFPFICGIFPFFP